MHGENLSSDNLLSTLITFFYFVLLLQIFHFPLIFIISFPLLQLQNPSFLCPFISRSFCCSPLLFFSFPTSLPKFYTSLFCFISQYESHDSTFRASCSPPNCTHSLMGPDNTVTSTCRVLRQRSRRFKALLYRLGFIS